LARYPTEIIDAGFLDAYAHLWVCYTTVCSLTVRYTTVQYKMVQYYKILQLQNGTQS
jgi:hypothetical protein